MKLIAAIIATIIATIITVIATTKLSSLNYLSH